MKTKYPNQIDTPSELPIVRDNIFEIGSDAINSLRSAIIQIEKTLGVNPQGAVGLTVSERISKTLDPSGNLKTEALDAAGFIHGPVFDDQVSDVAAIKEAKLKLNFPTQVLQSQISVVSGMIGEIQAQIEYISAMLSAHTSSLATNRHPATAISTTEISSTGSGSGIKSLSASTVQGALDAVFSSHINYDGTGIATDNNSHVASQIYFDKSLASNVSSDDVQGAIGDISGLIGLGVVEHQDLLHSNGFARSSTIYDKISSNYGVLITDNSTVSIVQNLGERPYFEIILDTAIPIPAEQIGLGDLIELTIAGAASEYQVYRVQYDSGPTNITGFLLFGIFPSSESSVDAKIMLRRFRSYNGIGIVASNREKTGLSSSDCIQIINPDAPFILSSGFNAAEITVANRYFDVKINGTEYAFDVYDSGITTQSIDSAIRKINDIVDLLGLPILAFRVNQEAGGTELIIAHNVSSVDDANSSLELVRVDGSIDSLGLAAFESKIIYGQPGSSYYIGGAKYTGLLKKLDTTALSVVAGESTISSGSSAIDFLVAGVRIGDVINIIDTSINSYEIVTVTQNLLTISPRQLPTGFTSSSAVNGRFIIYESTTLVSSLQFLNVDASIASSLLEIFLDSSRNLYTNLVLEQESAAFVSESLYSIIGLYNPAGSTVSVITFENTTDNCVNIWLDGNQSHKRKVVGDFSYINLESDLKNFSCEMFVPDKTALYNYIGAAGDTKTANIFPAPIINRENNLIIGNTIYSNFLGKFDGGINGALFVSGLNFGNLDDKDLSTSFKHNLSERPTSELRSPGVISGLEVTLAEDSGGIYKVTITDGTCYVGGKRFEIIGASIITGIDTTTYDKLFVGIDRYGKISFSPPDPSCSYPWAEEEILLLATVENNGSSIDAIDQRLFIDHLDLKLINSITVSPHTGMGHFTDIVKAIRYAKRFSQIYPLAGTPEIKLKAGVHETIIDDATTMTLVNWLISATVSGQTTERTAFYDNLIKSGFTLDFPISIIGEGTSTSLRLVYRLAASDQTVSWSAPLTIIGSGFNTLGDFASIPHGSFSSGNILLSNFKIGVGGILLLDLNNYLDPSSNYGFKLNIEKILFENSTEGGAITDQFLNIRFQELSDTTNFKGNVTITSCTFLGGEAIKFLDATFFGSTSPVRYRHLFISDNQTDSVNGICVPDLFDVTKFLPGYDIYAVGNSTMLPLSGSIDRKDRISADLVVGRDLYVSDTAEIATNIISPLYSVEATKSIVRKYFAVQSTEADQIRNWARTATTRPSYVTVPIGVAGPTQIQWPAFELTTTAELYIPIELHTGEKIKSVKIGVEPDLGITWTYNIYKFGIGGGALVSDPYTLLDGPNSAITTNFVTRLGNVNITSGYTVVDTDEGNIFILNLLHDSALTRYIFYVEVIIEGTSLNNFIGLY